MSLQRRCKSIFERFRIFDSYVFFIIKKKEKKNEKFDKVEFIITYENIIRVGLSNNVSLLINICIKINQTQIQAFQFSCCRV